MRSDQQDEEERKHDTREFLAETSPDEFHGIRVVTDEGVSHLDLSNDVGRVDGDETESNAEDDTSDHSEFRECVGNTERAEGNSLDDQADGKAFPAQAVELLMAFLHRRGLVEGCEFDVALFTD